MIRPMLDDLELQQVQMIEVDGDQVWTQHSIPALEGDFFQGLGRRAAQITLAGVLTGAEVGEGLKNLRDKFRAAAPVSFVADIATATRIDQVLIEEMGVREVAGKPARFEYAFTLREYQPAVPPERRRPPPPPPPPPLPPVLQATLEVQVKVRGQPAFDHSGTTVLVQGRKQDGSQFRQQLTNRTGDVWTESPFPPGNWTAHAETAPPTVLTGSNSGTLEAGKTHRIVIELVPEEKNVAKAFVVHYWFDKAFVEPCMRHVLHQVSDYALAHPNEKMVIVGHTDESGSDEYNQSLSERRARGVYACLTVGRGPADEDTAVAEWNELRKTRTTGVTKTVHDTWGVRQYQQMLQELGFYRGAIGDVHNALTDQAVRDFQASQGLTPDGVIGDATWPVLIRQYLRLDPLAVPETQLMPNAKDGCDHGFVRWLGCGEKMPEPTTPRSDTQPPPDPPVTCSDPAWRPNRRTEILFVNAAAFPCEISKPVTFDLPQPNSGGSGWCLGPGNPNERCCFLTDDPNETGKWVVRLAETQTTIVRGRIQFEDGTPLANTDYILIAPDGEFMNDEHNCGPTGTKGTAILGRTDAGGNFTDRDGNIGYPNKPKGVGIFTLEIQADVMARNQGAPLTEAKGPVVCKRLDGSSDFIVIVQDRGSFVIPTLAITDNTAPFDTAVTRVQIEGILNRDRTSFDLTDLSAGQATSLFRVRADMPGVTGTTLRARLTAIAVDGSTIETHDITLTQTAGTRFVSRPILAVPRAIPRAEVTFAAPQSLEIIRTQAAGRLKVELINNPPHPVPAVTVPVRGRVLEFCTITIDGAAPNIDGNLGTANRVMAQCGIEFRILRREVVDNAALLDIDQPSCPLTIGGDNNRGAEEQALFALGRADCTTNFLVYFVRSNSLGLLGCSAYPVGRPGATIADGASQYTFAHEVGHVLHLPHDGRPDNLMTGAGTLSLPADPANVHLLPDQCTLMNNSGFLVFRE